MIGIGLVGVLANANWNKIREMFEESPLEFVLYKYHSPLKQTKDNQR